MMPSGDAHALLFDRTFILEAQYLSHHHIADGLQILPASTDYVSAE